MRVLVVKTSSLGDLIHTFPALSDARCALPDIEFHWLVEEAFAEVPAWHPGVSTILPIALRRWRGNWRKAWRKGELSRFKQQLQQHSYDLVIDAQGLLKSALPARWANGPVAGYDRHSVREPLASFFYAGKYPVSRQLHAVERIRRLFALALGYPEPREAPDFGLTGDDAAGSGGLVFLHSTTWASKHWPLAYWVELTQTAGQEGFDVAFPWYAPEERLRAEKIMARAGHGVLLPRMNLSGMKQCLQQAAGVVGVDTGLAHLAAALNTPAITLYGPTAPGLTGAVGRRQKNLSVDWPCAPCMKRDCSYQEPAPVNPACYQSLAPEIVWTALRQQMVNP
ncbi:heptosyltransferase I [Thiolapillus brandeum]|uniref:Lipopolysaccharide heptosyltransferase 1 n=2 Tax=Thiolapillus brandeum TaxID=1076588 RepID=A0A7U6GL70_9GAMM|nr:heptosyltransferase I [Thiolapillus brandeum]